MGGGTKNREESRGGRKSAGISGSAADLGAERGSKNKRPGKRNFLFSAKTSGSDRAADRDRTETALPPDKVSACIEGRAEYAETVYGPGGIWAWIL